jgi:hypothetical protein
MRNSDVSGCVQGVLVKRTTSARLMQSIVWHGRGITTLDPRGLDCDTPSFVDSREWWRGAKYDVDADIANLLAFLRSLKILQYLGTVSLAQANC